jgi:branched-subunit amino acid aminotransferase/4-amino-4-deoxychorismate lyase
VDQEGFVGEATNANVLIYRQSDGLISPPRERILPGVTLAATEELALCEGISFTERLFRAQDLQSADEVLLVGTSICLLPVVSCGGRAIGTGTPGRIYHQLLAAWNSLAGLDVAEQARRFSER